MNFYNQTKFNLEALIESISRKVNSEEYFEKERVAIYLDKIERAAQFYYLNRTCFNGIYRVNQAGKFNVPYGRRSNLQVVDRNKLAELNKKLQFTTITSSDFQIDLNEVDKNSFFFLDPPYSPMVRENYFLMYNDKMFRWEDQIRLKNFCEELKERDIPFVITNLYNNDVMKLFKDDCI